MKRLKILFILLLVAAAPSRARAADPLPSWNEGLAKQAIVAFVEKATKPGGDFVRPEERIAVFDNDGTLWTEQPLYFQFLFMIEQVKVEAKKHPEWKASPAFQALQKGDHSALFGGDHKALMELLAQANSGMTTADYGKRVLAWVEKAKHPRFKRPYVEITYRPMKELLAYLRAEGFKTFIVSGGDIEFMRPWTERAYGIPPEQVVGSMIELKYELKDGEPVLIREPKIQFIDDGPGKPVGIFQHIGRRPIAAFGNSDGDLQMLQWTAAGKGPSLMMLVHHDDAEREYAYDRESKIGTLNKAWDEAVAKGWTVISMKQDWKEIF